MIFPASLLLSASPCHKDSCEFSPVAKRDHNKEAKSANSKRSTCDLFTKLLNLQSGYVSPQYHVVHDNLFTTVPNGENGGIIDVTDFDADHWSRLVASGLDRSDALQPDFDTRGRRIPLPDLEEQWLTPLERQARA